MKIMVVDDHVLFRESLVSLLNNQHDLHVIGEAGTVDDAVDLAMELTPDLILMDIGLPDSDGLEATRMIISRQPNIKIIILTLYETDELLFKAINYGAKGFLLKNLPAAKLLAVIRATEQGEAAFSRKMVSRILDHFSSANSNPMLQSDAFDMLTPRELEILHLIVAGEDNHQIAKTLVLTENTVKVHVHNIFKKLNLHSRRQAAIYAQQKGLTRNPIKSAGEVTIKKTL